MYCIANSSLQMCNYKFSVVSIEITLKYILIYYKCLSVHSAVLVVPCFMVHVSNIIEIFAKLHVNKYVLLTVKGLKSFS